MSEYWKSIPKYWCKHCRDFVTDTPLGRKNHEATAKHQVAIKRFLRDLHRENERALTATSNAKREVERLNALVSGSSSSSSAVTPSVAKPDQKNGERWGIATRLTTEEEKKRQMKELEMLGVAMPEEFRGDLALPGEWTTVSVEEAKRPLSEKEMLQKELAEMRGKEEDQEERKRKWDELDEDDKAIRSFTIQTRSYPGAQEEGDISALFAKKGKGKVTVEEKVEANSVDFKIKKEDDDPVQADANSNMEPDSGALVKAEQEDISPGFTTFEENKEIAVDVKKEDGPPAGDGVVFKKRKVKAMRKKY